MKAALLGLTLACAAAPSLAAEPPWFVAGALGVPQFGDCPGGASCDGSDLAYKVYGGYRFNRYFALEAGYTDLGKNTATAGDSITEVKPRGITTHVVGSWPFAERWSALGRLGLIYGDTKVTGTAGTRNEKGTEFAWGVGLQFDFTHEVAVRLEWERFRFGSESDVDAITLGVVARF
jgi:OOP family OmpA-OmpF porin